MRRADISIQAILSSDGQGLAAKTLPADGLAFPALQSQLWKTKISLLCRAPVWNPAKTSLSIVAALTR
jgi:hypothetical protein